MRIIIGVDIGGTKLIVASALVQNNKILKQIRKDTPKYPDEGIHLIKKMIRDVSKDNEIVSIGAAAGSPLDRINGIITAPVHQPYWKNVKIGEELQKEFGCPFFLDNDCNLAALAEYKYGDHNVSNLIYITISTGVGGGIILDGHIYRGKNGEHPEIGHQTIDWKIEKNHVKFDPNKDLPNNQRYLENFISGSAIRRIYGKAPEDLDDSYWEEIGYNFGQGLRNIIHSYAPDLIVLGGGVVLGAGQKLLKPALNHINENVLIVPIPKICISKIGENNVVLGSIIQANQKHH